MASPFMEHVYHSGPLAIRFTADISDELKLKDCDSTPVTLDIASRETHELLLTTCHSVNARIAWLLQESVRKRIEIHQFNCISTVRFVLAAEDILHWLERMKEQGTKICVQDALKALPPPFVFQICGKFAPNIHKPEEKIHGILHTGLVVGNSEKGPIVFEKDWWRAIKFSLWSEVENRFFADPKDSDIEYVTFFDTKDLQK